jgi:hypothetical protein
MQDNHFAGAVDTLGVEEGGRMAEPAEGDDRRVRLLVEEGVGQGSLVAVVAAAAGTRLRRMHLVVSTAAGYAGADVP